MKRGWLLLLGGALAVGAAAQEGGTLPSVKPGQWRLREIGTGASARSVCAADIRALVQIQHEGPRCKWASRVSDTPDKLDVRYECAGAGYGQTLVTVESAELARVQTQGLIKGQPFDFDYEARRVGECR